jgi:hypothetical protein
MRRVRRFCVSDCGAGKCWRSSVAFRAAWSGWKRVRRRITGHASGLRERSTATANRCGQPCCISAMLKCPTRSRDASTARQMSASVFHPSSGRPDCVAEVVGFELTNVAANYPFEGRIDFLGSRTFPQAFSAAATGSSAASSRSDLHQECRLIPIDVLVGDAKSKPITTRCSSTTLATGRRHSRQIDAHFPVVGEANDQFVNNTGLPRRCATMASPQRRPATGR